MASLVGTGLKAGFQIINYYFCKQLQGGDYTNEQILSLFENRLISIAKDLEDLKLQKLRSATFLFKSGVKMAESNDISEAERNFDKAEMDAVEAFSTAPNVDWKILSVKIAICSHIWRKVVLKFMQHDSYIQFQSVLVQVSLLIQRLLDDEGIRNNVKTHVSHSLLSNFNKAKRAELVNNIVELYANIRNLLFDNFLEILPPFYFNIDHDGRSSQISILSLTAYKKELVPFSPKQCLVFSGSAAISRWKNIVCDISLERNAENVMASIGFDSSEAVHYVVQRKWVDLHLDLAKNAGTIQTFNIEHVSKLLELTNVEEKGTSAEDNIYNPVFVHIRVLYSVSVDGLPHIAVSLDSASEDCANSLTFHRVVRCIGSTAREFSALFHAENNLMSHLRSTSEDIPLRIAVTASNIANLKIQSIEMIVHYKHGMGGKRRTAVEGL